uniref:Immunoglobulin like and fibronectin type III domain containing 1, tandem duplicate 3 n=1 Tax=Myripristis murdjan TaxID=586833 RepID=A0A667YYL5_9TELE
MWKPMGKRKKHERKRSKIPGVMITQLVANIPAGKSTPDFQRKPITLTIQEGKLAVFKAVVTGDPKPQVNWTRAKGEISEDNRFQSKYDESSGEYTLEIHKVSGADADTYKCFATNEYGKAVCTATLNVIEVGFKKEKAMEELDLFCYLLHAYSKVKEKPMKKEDGEVDERFWEIILNADRKDYERICAEYGVKDLRLILKKLEEKKQERVEEQNQYVEYLRNLRHIEVKGDGTASFEFEMELKDPTSRIFLYKDGVMIPYSDDTSQKHSLKTVGKKVVFSIKDLVPEDAGLYQVDVEEVNVFATEFRIPKVDFLVKIQEVKAKEREDAVFECALSHPLAKIKWMGKNSALEDGDKYSITVSDDKLIHRLVVKDCKQLDKGIYSAVAGIKSCSAWLVVEAPGKKKARKTTSAGGAGIDLEQVAKEQQIKIQQEKDKLEAAIKEKKEEEKPIVEEPSPNASFVANATKDVALKTENRTDSGCVTKEEVKLKEDDTKSKKQETEYKWTDKEYFENDGGFISGLSDVSAIIGETAEMACKLSSEDCEGSWFKDGKKISTDEDFIIIKEGATHKLVINSCKEEHSGKYRFEADGRKTEAMINVKDPPRFDPDDLSAFTQPVTVKVGQNAIFKMPFVGHEPMKIQWYREGEELRDDSNIKIEKSASHSRLLLSKCQRKDTGEIKLRLKNEHGITEAITQLIVLDKPTPPQGPAEIIESSACCVEFKWRPPKDDGGSPVINYVLERQQVGRNTWKKIGEIPGVPSYRDTDVEHGRRYCYRIQAKTTVGLSEVMETDDIQAGTLAFPGPPAPPKVVSASNDCIILSWAPPANTGGSRILGYILEKRKNGSNLWGVVNDMDELIKEKSYAVKDVVAGMEYEFRVTAINMSGAGEFSNPSEFVFARDPKMRPRFTNRKMKSFMVVKAGNSVRITVAFEASPRPEITWLKDNVPVTKRVTCSNSDDSSQMLIPSSERSDSGIYSIVVKNLAGQETFSIEVRVTDDPKPPGPVELEENVPGTVTVIWEPSPDEKRDDRLHYTVSKLDSTKRTWSTVADRLFNNKFTVCNIMHGREYHFRVYAKNDMGISAPSESPTWGVEKKRAIPVSNKKFVVTIPTKKECDLRCAPTFIVPLKLHTAPKGYECYMSCAVKGNPKPRITWYRNNISLNTNTNYYISNTCGVCSMLILRVGPKDMGEYTITAENALGRAECSTTLNVRGEREADLC